MATKLQQFGNWLGQQGAAVVDAGKAAGETAEQTAKRLGDAILAAAKAGEIAIGNAVKTAAGVMTGALSPDGLVQAMASLGDWGHVYWAIDTGMRIHAAEISVGGKAYRWDTFPKQGPGEMLFYLAAVSMAKPSALQKAFGVAGLDASDSAMGLDGSRVFGADKQTDAFGADSPGADAGSTAGGYVGPVGDQVPTVTDPPAGADNAPPTPPNTQGNSTVAAPDFLQVILTTLLALGPKIFAWFKSKLSPADQPPTTTPSAPPAGPVADTGPSVGMILLAAGAIYYFFFYKPGAE